MRTNESRPEGAAVVVAGGPTASISPTEVDVEAIAAHVDGTFVVVVQVTGSRYRRRCFLTVKAAEDAARRATDAGHNAVVVLAELKPLYRLTGGEG